MRTDELERLLETALHEADVVPVDVPRGRVDLIRRQEQHRSKRRWIVAAAAATVLAITMATSLVLGVLRDTEEKLPVGPSPEVTLSPSGLPVGLLEATVDRSGSQVVSTVRMVVRPDGTGTYNNGTPAGPDASTAEYAVEFVKDGPGRVVLMNKGDAACVSSDLLTLGFTVRGRTVAINDAYPNNSECVVSRGLASDLVGATMRILPLPPEISPSGG